MQPAPVARRLSTTPSRSGGGGTALDAAALDQVAAATLSIAMLTTTGRQCGGRPRILALITAPVLSSFGSGGEATVRGPASPPVTYRRWVRADRSPRADAAVTVPRRPREV